MLTDQPEGQNCRTEKYNRANQCLKDVFKTSVLNTQTVAINSLNHPFYSQYHKHNMSDNHTD